jgi:hypothetical protein
MVEEYFSLFQISDTKLLQDSKYKCTFNLFKIIIMYLLALERIMNTAAVYKCN